MVLENFKAIPLFFIYLLILYMQPNLKQGGAEHTPQTPIHTPLFTIRIILLQGSNCKTIPILIVLLLYFLFLHYILPRITLPDFTPISSKVSLPFVSCCDCCVCIILLQGSNCKTVPVSISVDPSLVFPFYILPRITLPDFTSISSTTITTTISSAQSIGKTGFTIQI